MTDPVLEPTAHETQPGEPPPPPKKAARALWAWAVFLLLAVATGIVTIKILQPQATGSASEALAGGGVALLPSANRAPRPAPGSPAPTFTLETLEGKTVSLAGYRGQAVMVNFWATWCIPCRIELLHIQQVYEEREGQGFTVLAVNIQEAREPVAGFVAKLGLTFPILLDTAGEVTQLYGIYGLPSSYFIDRQGRVAEVYVGLLSKAAISQRVDRTLQ